MRGVAGAGDDSARSCGDRGVTRQRPQEGTIMATTTLPATRHPLAPVAVTAWTVALFWTFYGAHDWTEIAIGVAAITLATGLVFGLVAPRALSRTSAAGWSLGLGVVAVLAT